MNNEQEFYIENNAVITWIMQHWMLAAILLLAVILIIILIIMMFFKLSRSRKKMKETKGLKKDLQIWENLASLVQGGNEAREARAKLSTELKLITALLKSGLRLIKQAKRSIYSMPWYVLLGEPRSGKSLLLKNCDAGFVSSTSEQSFENESKQSLPLCCWLGAKAFILDVSGKVFFDRWLEDSSAEWTHFLRLVSRYHRRMPINGILLTIPVDALLTDDEQLTRQKLDLIAAELHQLLKYTEEKISCQVIVTKMDMLTGFREYFQDSDDKLRESVFGWKNIHETKDYDPQDFSAYFAQTCEKLRSAAEEKMFRPDFFHQTQENTPRIDTTGKIYIFPDSFASLENKLNVYLNTLFGEDNWHNSDCLKLSGVYFTSSRDQGVTFSEQFAALSSKSIEQAVMTEKEMAVPAFFSKELLSKQIHNMQQSSFTPIRQFRRELPGYLVCALLLFLACSWFISTATKEYVLRGNFTVFSDFYNTFSNMIQKISLKQSPILKFDSKTKKTVFLAEEPVKGFEAATRLNFYYNIVEQTARSIQMPYGFKASSCMLFGFNKSRERHMRSQIINELHQQMVLDPLVDAVCQKVLSQQQQEPFSHIKRDVMFNFCNYSNPDFMVEKSFTDACLKYLFPDMEDEKIDSFAPPKNVLWMSRQQESAERVFDIRYMQAAKLLLEDFAKAWENFTIYPNSSYQQWRTLLYACQDYQHICDKILPPSAKDISAGQMEQWKKKIAERANCCRTGKLLRHDLLGDQPLDIPSVSKEKTKNIMKKTSIMQSLAIRSLFRLAERKYRQQFQEDFEIMEKYKKHIQTIMPPGNTSNILQLDDVQKQAFEKKLEDYQKNERKKIIAFIKSAEASPYFKPLHCKNKEITLKEDTPAFVHELVYRLDAMLLNMKAPSAIRTIQDFQPAWERLTAQNTDLNQKLTDYTNKYEGEVVQKLIKDARLFVDAQTQIWKKQLTEQLLALYPQSKNAFDKCIANREKRNTMMKLPIQLSEESIGNMSYRNNFSPAGALYYWKPVKLLSEIKPQKGAPPYLAQFDSRKDVLISLQAYTDDYIAYWGTYVDKQQKIFASWKDFRKYCATLKPYMVNTLLQKMYEESISNLKMIPDSILSAAAKKKRNEYLVTLGNRIQTLNTQFSQICIGQLSAWSMLPESALDAYRKINALPGKQLKTEYLAVIAAGKKCDIPWWDNFFRNGSIVLKKDAGEALSAPLKQKKNSWLRFPLCADSTHGKVMEAMELSEVFRIIKDIGFTAQPANTQKNMAKSNEPADPIISFANLGIAAQMDPETQKWGANLQIILDALLNPQKELVWTVYVPSASIQKKLMTEKLRSFPDAGIRYRYWNIRDNGKAVGRKVSTVSSTAFSSSALLNDLDLCFYAFTDDVVPAAKVHIPGPWAILRLYLDTKAVYDAEKSITYVPVFVKDRMQQKSLIWLALKFNKKLPVPQEWPSMKNWPEFSRIQSAYLRKRMIPLTNWNILVSSAKNYDTLLKQLCNYDRQNYPMISVYLDGGKIRHTGWRYRYMDMAVPGIRTARVQLSTKMIPLGTIPLMTSEIRFRFYRSSIQKKPSYEIIIPGEYASLRLLTTSGRKTKKNGFEIVCRQGNGISVPLFLELEAVK